MYHTGTGIIKYDPHRFGMKHKTAWWAVLNVDKEITRYYRWWIQKEYHLNGLRSPSWDAHISIIRGEKPTPRLMHLWKKYDGQQVTFKYQHNPRYSGNTTGGDRPNCFWFVEIDCIELINIRKELELPYDWKLHLTVGKTVF